MGLPDHDFTDDAPHGAMRGQDLLLLLLALALGSVPALVGQDAIQRAAGLFPLAEGANPYFVPAHAGLLYLWAPLVAISACLLLFTPGLLLALALNVARGVGHWVVFGLAVSVLVVSTAAALAQSVLGSPLRGSGFAGTVVACSVVCFGILALRIVCRCPPAWPLRRKDAGFTLLSMLVVPALLLMALTPKVYGENFNGDGAHAFEASRLLLFRALPFWGEAAGDVGAFPGVTSMLFAYPTSWFIRLFGEVEASARLPLFLFLPALYGAILALAEHGRASTLGYAARALIWLGLSVYVVVMAFSATYFPYSADLALPATQDTLLVICFLGFVLTFLADDAKWVALFVALTVVAEPNGVMLIGLWLLAVLALWRPRPWRQTALVAGAVGLCLTLATLAPVLLPWMGQPPPGREYGLLGLLKRFAFLQVDDWRRLAFLVVPCGILPALSLCAWSTQDRVARALTAVTITYFLFFYVQAHIALHHFAPVMVLPLVVFWRGGWTADRRWSGILLGGASVAGLLALGLSLPRNTTIYTDARTIGSTIDDRIGGYEVFDLAVFRRSELLHHLFPYDWEPSVPTESHGGSPLMWNYYAQRMRGMGGPVNYVVQYRADYPPAGMTLIAEDEVAALYLRDAAVWAGHRALCPPHPAGSPLYVIPRWVLFRSVRPAGGPTIISVLDVLEWLGVDTERLLNRLGVKR